MNRLESLLVETIQKNKGKWKNEHFQSLVGFTRSKQILHQFNVFTNSKYLVDEIEENVLNGNNHLF